MSATAAQSRLERFRQVLLAAMNTEHYRPWLEPGRIAAVTSIPEALARLPRLALEDFVRNRERFRNPHARPPALPRLHLPLEPLPRTAVLSEGFRTARKLRVFPNGLDRGFERFGPAAVAGPLDRLRGLGEATRDGRLALRSLDQAVVALTRIGQARLSGEDREMLWSCYQVPVFEEVLDVSGEPAACECEAHNTLHVREQAAFFETAAGELLFTSLVDVRHPVLRLATGWQGSVETGCCGCGQPGERISGTAAKSPNNAGQPPAPPML